MNSPEEAAPQITPHIKGIQVIGFISCRRIFQIELSPGAAPFIPKSCLVLALRSTVPFAWSVDVLESGVMGVESDIGCTCKLVIGNW